MSKKKAVVIGGLGFIGSNLVRELVKTHDVEVIDNLFGGDESRMIEGPNYHITDAKNISCVIADADVVFHLGEYARVEPSFDAPLECFKNNDQLIHVLHFCLDKGAQLVYACTSSVYTEHGKFLTPYTLSKHRNVELIEAYTNWYGLRAKLTYFYNVYGPGENSSGKNSTVVGKFLSLHQQGKELTVTAPGTQERNFTHVDDTVSGILCVYEKGDDGVPYGIASPDSYSVLDIAEKLGDYTVSGETKRGNRSSSDISIAANTTALGWSPSHNLMDYLDEQLLDN